MKEGIKLIAITGSMLALMATGVLAAANSDEGQAGGTKATKQSAPSGGMKAEGDGPGLPGVSTLVRADDGIQAQPALRVS